MIAATNPSHTDDVPQQTNLSVQPSKDLKPPRAFAGTKIFYII